MGKTLFYILMGIFVIAGISTTIYYGLQPRPIAKINFSTFETKDILADSVLMRLREEIMNSPLLVLGIQPEHPEQLEIWQKFMEKNQDPKMKYSLTILESHLEEGKALFPTATILDTKEQSRELLEGVQKALSQGERVVILVPNLYGAQIIQGNVINQLKAKSTTLNPMSISLSDFPRTREQEKEMRPLCMTNVADQTGEGALACLVVGAARANYRKHRPTGASVGLLQQIGMKDYLLLFTKERAE